jgi:pimeloyl-ACP methyl ester carboxylesterase
MTDQAAVRVADGGGGGNGEPVLLLIHGLGATGAVWDPWRPLLDARWPGRWLAPDLPGHGDASPVARYSFGALAAALAELLEPEQPVVVLGHSLGGVLGLTLATGWYGVPVDTVVGLGIKVAWSPDELARTGTLARRPVTWFASRTEAAERYLRVSGLIGLLEPDAEAVSRGLHSGAGGWRLAMDPAAFGVGAPDMPGLLSASRARVVLARGADDQMVSAGQLATLDPSAVSLPGLGHNAHVEDPEAVLRLLMSSARIRADGPGQAVSRAG